MVSLFLQWPHRCVYYAHPNVALKHISAHKEQMEDLNSDCPEFTAQSQNHSSVLLEDTEFEKLKRVRWICQPPSDCQMEPIHMSCPNSWTSTWWAPRVDEVGGSTWNFLGPPPFLLNVFGSELLLSYWPRAPTFSLSHGLMEIQQLPAALQAYSDMANRNHKDLRRKQIWVQVLTLPLTGFETLGKLLPSVPVKWNK